MNVTLVLLPTTVKSAVLVTFNTTGTTSTVTLEITSVLFSLEITSTTLVKLPVALVLAVTINLIELPLTISVTFHSIEVLPSANFTIVGFKSFTSDSKFTYVKPAGK